MLKRKRVLAVIPARKGSKRLPGKNFQLLCDRPLIAWTIDAAKQARHINHIVVSTDYSDIVSTIDCDDIEIRPRDALLASDDASLTDVLIDILNGLAESGEVYQYLILLQPTSPLRTGAHIDCAFEMIDSHKSRGVISVCRTEHPLEWIGKIPPDGSLDTFFRQTKLDKQSQGLSPSYQVNGAIYIVPVDQFVAEKTLFLSEGMVAYVMDRRVSIDIDDEYDLCLADWLLKLRKKKTDLTGT